MKFNEKIILGKTGLKAGRLGLSSSFGAPSEAFLEAFEKGCNYWTWGTFIKGRSDEMRIALKTLFGKGKRDEVILSMYAYSHNTFFTERNLLKGLKNLETDYTDVLVLGYFNQKPSQKLIEQALSLKKRGLVRFLAISSHNRKLFPELLKENLFDIFHLRYNAAHRGAETEIFNLLPAEDCPGIVSFTATRWRHLLDKKNMPANETPPTAKDCYKFVLSNPKVDICMVGTKNLEEMRENLKILEEGPLSDSELEKMKKIGDFVRNKKKFTLF